MCTRYVDHYAKALTKGVNAPTGRFVLSAVIKHISGGAVTEMK